MNNPLALKNTFKILLLSIVLSTIIRCKKESKTTKEDKTITIKKDVSYNEAPDGMVWIPEKPFYKERKRLTNMRYLERNLHTM